MEAVDKAKADIVSAVKEFADQYNNTISFLADNEGRSSTVSRHLSSLQRGMLTQDALQTVGLSLDASGRLQVDEKKLNEALDQNVDFAKNTLGSQFGIAERVGEKATYILDYASPESVAGVSGLSSGSNDISSIDYMKLFAGYTRSGAYNLSNFYAVGMFLNTFA